MFGKMVIYRENEDYLPDTEITRKRMIVKVTARMIGNRKKPVVINHRNLFSVDANSAISIGRRGEILLIMLKQVNSKSRIVRLVAMQFSMSEKIRKRSGLGAHERSVKYRFYYEVVPNDVIGLVYGDIKETDLYKEGVVFILEPKLVRGFTKKVNETLKGTYTFKQITTNIGKQGTHECSYIVNITDVDRFIELDRDEITLAFTEALRLVTNPSMWCNYYETTKGDILIKVFNDRNFRNTDGTDIFRPFNDEPEIDEFLLIIHGCHHRGNYP